MGPLYCAMSGSLRCFVSERKVWDCCFRPSCSTCNSQASHSELPSYALPSRIPQVWCLKYIRPQSLKITILFLSSLFVYAELLKKYFLSTGSKVSSQLTQHSCSPSASATRSLSLCVSFVWLWAVWLHLRGPPSCILEFPDPPPQWPTLPSPLLYNSSAEQGWTACLLNINSHFSIVLHAPFALLVSMLEKIDEPKL